MEYLKNGQIHTALTEGYSSEGYGVVRLDGAVVFVPRAVRGERIDLRITRVTISPRAWVFKIGRAHV